MPRLVLGPAQCRLLTSPHRNGVATRLPGGSQGNSFDDHHSVDDAFAAANSLVVSYSCGMETPPIPLSEFADLVPRQCYVGFVDLLVSADSLLTTLTELGASTTASSTT